MRVWQAALVTLAISASAFVCVETYSPMRIIDLKIDRAQADLGALQLAIDAYKRDMGSLPGELSTLVRAGFVARVPNDPWGTAYVFRRVATEQGYVIYSAGRDSLDQGGGGDDIVTGEKQYRCDVYGVNCPMAPVEAARLGSLLVAALASFGLAVSGAMTIGRWMRMRRGA